MHDFLIKYVQDIQTISVAVQAISSIILVIVTISYVFFSYKLLHAPHRTILVPTSIKTVDNGWKLKVKNVGPGVAKNLGIRAIGKDFLSFDPLIKHRVWVNEVLSPAQGPIYLTPQEEAEYYFDKFLLSFDDPFFITWKSITEKTYKATWLFKEGEIRGINDKIIPLGYFRSFRWEIKWYLTRLFSPYYSFIKWYHFRKVSKSKRYESKIDK